VKPPGCHSGRVNLGDLFDPGLDPDKTALIAVDTDGDARHFTYRVLDRATAALADGLRSRGLRRGARIALLGANSAEYLVAYFAIMRAGLVAVPVNTQLPNGTTISSSAMPPPNSPLPIGRASSRCRRIYPLSRSTPSRSRTRRTRGSRRVCPRAAKSR